MTDIATSTSSFAPGTFIRRAALAAATAFAAPAALAQDSKTTSFDQALATMVASNTSILDNIENNLKLYARALGSPHSPQDGSNGNFNSRLQKNSLSALQKALREYRDIDMNPGRLPQIDVTGALDEPTAGLLLKVAQEIRFHDLFFLEPLPAYDAETALGLAKLRLSLKIIAPQDYIQALESISIRLDEERRVYLLSVENSLAQSFTQCALSLQEHVLPASSMKMEIERAETEEDYISPMVADECYAYLNPLPKSARKSAHLDFLHQAPSMPEKRQEWCSRQATADERSPCLEHKI